MNVPLVVAVITVVVVALAMRFYFMRTLAATAPQRKLPPSFVNNGKRGSGGKAPKKGSKKVSAKRSQSANGSKHRPATAEVTTKETLSPALPPLKGEKRKRDKDPKEVAPTPDQKKHKKREQQEAESPRPLHSSDKVPSADSLSDFVKIEVSRGDSDLEGGWEIVEKKPRKPKKSSDLLPIDVKDTTRPRTPKEKRYSKNTDRPRLTRSEDRRRPKLDGKKKNLGAGASVEKKPPRDVRIGQFIFSRSDPLASDTYSSPWDALVKLVHEKSAAASPLGTSLLEVRYYRPVPQPPKAKPAEVWEEMAKYNYTVSQSKSQDDKENDGNEGGEEDAITTEEELVSAFLRSLGGRYSEQLNKSYLEKGKVKHFLLPQNDIDAVKQELHKLITQSESPLCEDEEKAKELAEKVLVNFDASSLRVFSHAEPRLWTCGSRDEGFFFFDSSRIGLFWFLG